MATQTIATVDLSIRNPHDTNLELIDVYRFILNAHDAWALHDEGTFEEYSRDGGCLYCAAGEGSVHNYEPPTDRAENEQALSEYESELESRVNDLPGFNVDSDGNYVTVTRTVPENVEEWIEFHGIDTHLEFDAIHAYASNLSLEWSTMDEWIEAAEEAYSGEFGSDAEFAQSLADDLGVFDSSAAWPHTYIDWDRAAHDLMMDYFEDNGHYFRNM